MLPEFLCLLKNLLLFLVFFCLLSTKHRFPHSSSSKRRFSSFSRINFCSSVTERCFYIHLLPNVLPQLSLFFVFQFLQNFLPNEISLFLFLWNTVSQGLPEFFCSFSFLLQNFLLFFSIQRQRLSIKFNFFLFCSTTFSLLVKNVLLFFLFFQSTSFNFNLLNFLLYSFH